jgi:SAM-dependent methyltransferase
MTVLLAGTSLSLEDLVAVARGHAHVALDGGASAHMAAARAVVERAMARGDTVYGALGAFSVRASAFDASQVALVRALADHAAASMSNARLIEALDGSRVELAKRADVERSLRDITARISAAADLPAVLQSAVDEAARLLRADGARIDLIDAEHRALEAARANLADPRASFHWLDLANEPAPATYDAIVCNPPFHVSRAAEPALGQGIIGAAARALRPGGRFYMVANRGLPYEPPLKANFASFETLADNNKFRISRAIR